MFKYMLNAEGFAALTAEQQAAYKKVGDSYVLNVDGLPDVDGLKSKNEELLGKLKDSNGKLTEAEKAQVAAMEDAARKAGDVKTLDASYAKKIADMTAAHEKENTALKNSINGLLIDGVANKMASDLFGDASAVGLPHIKSRLRVEADSEGKHVTRVLDAAGQISAMTVEDLGKEFAGNKMFAGILKGPGSQGTKPRNPTNPAEIKQPTVAGGDADLLALARGAIANMDAAE